MTPDEMKVLARIANRNSHEESPIVLNDSRIIDIPSIDPLPLTLEEKVEQLMLNVQEAQQALTRDDENAYSTIFGDMADQIEKDRLNIINIKNTLDSLPSNNNFDELNLSPLDVLLDVKKTRKLNGDTTSDHDEYTNILSHFGNTATYDNTKAFFINNLETPPLNALDLESVDNTLVSATRINKQAVKLGDDFDVGSVNKVEIAQKRSALTVIDNPITANILNIDFVVENDTAKTLRKVVSSDIYSSVSSGDVSTTFYYLKTVGTSKQVYKHIGGQSTTNDINAITSDLTSNGGIYYFANGFLVNLVLSSGIFTLSGAGVAQTVGSNTLYSTDSTKYVFRALNTVGVYDSGFSSVQMLKSESTLTTPLPIAGITRTNKLITITTSGSATQPNSSSYMFKIMVSGLLRLCTISSGFLTALANTSYVLDLSSFKVSHNTSTGISNIADGYYKSSDNSKLYRFINGEFNYTEFGVVGSSNNNSGTVYFADEKPDVIDSDATNSPIAQQYALPASVADSSTFEERAITLSSSAAVTVEYYISADNKLRKVSDGSVVTSKNGIFKVTANSIPKYYEIIQGAMTLYNGLVFNNNGVYNTVLLGVATALSDGVYVDANNRVISVNAGAWNPTPTGGLNNDYIRITENNSFIVRKLVVQSDKNIFLLATADEYTDAGALVNIDGHLYKIPAFNEPVVKAPNTYFRYSNDQSVLLKSNDDSLIMYPSLGLYGWNSGNAVRIHQIKANGVICWISSSEFNAFTYGTTSGDIRNPLFIEKKLVGSGKLFKYDASKGALANLPEGRWWLPNFYNSGVKTVLSVGSQNYNILSADNVTSDNTSNQYKNIYYEITSNSNKPITARLLRSDQHSNNNINYLIYLLDEYGMSSTQFGENSSDVFITKPDNSLELWTNGLKQGEQTNISYIAYDDKLSKTSSMNGSRGSIYTGNYWVKLTEIVSGHPSYSYHVFENGVEVPPVVSKIVNVNSTKTSDSDYNAENGLRFYGKIAGESINRWHFVSNTSSSLDNAAIDARIASAVTASGALKNALDSKYIASSFNTDADARIANAVTASGALKSALDSKYIASSFNTDADARADIRITNALGNGGAIKTEIETRVATNVTNLNTILTSGPAGALASLPDLRIAVRELGNERILAAITNNGTITDAIDTTGNSSSFQAAFDVRAEARANERITAAHGNAGALTEHVNSGSVDLKTAVEARADARSALKITAAHGLAGALTDHVNSGSVDLKTAVEDRADARSALKITAAHGLAGALTDHVETGAADLKTAVEARADARSALKITAAHGLAGALTDHVNSGSVDLKTAVEDRADARSALKITAAHGLAGALTDHVETGAADLKTAVEARADARSALKITAAHGLAGALTDNVESGAADLKTAVEARADARSALKITAAHGLAGTLTDHVESGAADLKTAVEARADARSALKITAAHGLAGALTDHVESGAADLKTAVEARADAKITVAHGNNGVLTDAVDPTSNSGSLRDAVVNVARQSNMVVLSANAAANDYSRMALGTFVFNNTSSTVSYTDTTSTSQTLAAGKLAIVTDKNGNTVDLTLIN